MSAIHLGKSDDGKQLPWARKMEHPLDQPVNAASPDFSFLMNLGPTGIRAIIEPENPKAFKVMFVFQDAMSPAKGKINKGDMIVGANGHDFKVEHAFHRKQANAVGWAGPPFELALAIEDSQGKDGKLNLTVMRGGSRSTVSIQLKPVGRFASTYPWDCPRSDKLLKSLCDFLFEEKLNGRPDEIQSVLALWASGDKRAIPLVKSKAEGLMKSLANPMDGGMCTWMWGYNGIFLGEYYNAFKDKGVLPAVIALVDCYETGQDWKSGGYSHRPFPAIERRVAEGGPKGYGSMAGPGGLSMLAQSIFKTTGLPYSKMAYERTHQAFLRTAGGNPNGAIAYGFSGWNSVQIHVQEKAAASKSKRGIGFISPIPLKDAGSYKVENWTEAGGKWDMKLDDAKAFPWLKENADKLYMYDLDKNRRLVVQDGTLPEPTSPYNTGMGGGGHNAPVGMGALAHYIGNSDNKSWNYLGKHMATCCARSPKTLWDGHASSVMHAFFGVLGAARADEKDFRAFLDYSKTWIILSETHDGKGLVEQPFGLDRNSTCSISLDRQVYTHVAILLLSLPKKQLLITGAESDGSGAGKTTSAKTGSGARKTTSAFARPTSQSKQPAEPKQPPREARKLAPESLVALNTALLSTLAKMSADKMLEPILINLAATQKVLLTAANPDGALTVKTQNGKETTLKFNDLKGVDHGTLALLVANLKPASGDAQAMAGVYMESLGRIADADKYFEKAGEESKKKLEKLFE